LLSPFALQRSPRHWPDPDSFDPSRFLAGNEKRLEPFAYFPFGGGPRACIGARHPKWGERPVLLLKAAEGGEAPSTEEMREFLSDSFARWQLPDAVIEVDDIPLTATGKIDKKPLRAEFRDCLSK